MKRFSGDTLLLAGLLLLFGFLTYRVVGEASEGPELRPQRSTYSAKPGGYKAAFLLLKNLGLPVARCEAEPSRWPRDARVMVTLTPQERTGAWDKKQVEAARKWVERGNTLIVASDEPNTLLHELELETGASAKKTTPLIPQQPASFLAGVAKVETGTERWNQTGSRAVRLLGDKKPFAVVFENGRGRVYAFASPDLWENARLGQEDNARLFAQIAATEWGGDKSGRIYFDEFHQGYTGEQSFWSAIGAPGQWAVYQLIAVALLAIYSAGRRFGLARPMPPAARVSSEYVTSLADLYRRARANDAALSSVYSAFRRDLCREAGMPVDAPNAELAKRAAAALSQSDRERAEVAARLAGLLARCEAAIAQTEKRLTEPELLALARELDQTRKDLQIGT